MNRCGKIARVTESALNIKSNCWTSKNLVDKLDIIGLQAKCVERNQETLRIANKSGTKDFGRALGRLLVCK